MKASLVTEVKTNERIPELAPGDTVKVAYKVIEGDKSRIQPFQGVIIRIHPHDGGGSFTVRRVTYNIGVERTFLFNSPLVDKVDVLRHGKVRRANLYYVRGISERASRLKERRRVVLAPELAKQAEAPEEAPEAATPDNNKKE